MPPVCHGGAMPFSKLLSKNNNPAIKWKQISLLLFTLKKSKRIHPAPPGHPADGPHAQAVPAGNTAGRRPADAGKPCLPHRRTGSSSCRVLQCRDFYPEFQQSIWKIAGWIPKWLIFSDLFSFLTENDTPWRWNLTDFDTHLTDFDTSSFPSLYCLL